jgi:two-component system chemotaxis response regulator CheB
VVVAPPDRHLVVVDGRVALTIGPRENGHRPSVDVLFRSAAEAKDSHVVGVVLSGTRDDGTVGLAVIKAKGGSAVVQDPEDALYPGMPSSALAHVEVDAIAPSNEIGAVIVRLLSQESARAAQGNDPDQAPPGEPVVSVCPECGGVLSEHLDAGVMQWRCKVGHRYSAESLADAQATGVEATLWAAIRALQDRQALLGRMAVQLEQRDMERSARSLRTRASEAREHAEAIKVTLGRAAETTLRPLADDDDDDVSGSHGQQKVVDAGQ